MKKITALAWQFFSCIFFCLQDGTSINYVPTKDLKISIDKDYVINNNLVPADMADKIVPEISWKVKQSYLYKNDLMLFDLIASNNWERPIYFTSPSAINDVMDVDKYCHLEGLVYRFLPVVADSRIQGLGGINVDETFDLLVNKAKWGNLNDPKVYIDPESRRNSVMPKQNYFRLAQALADINRMDSAVMVLDTLQKYFPNSKIPYDIYAMPMVETYYEAGAIDKAAEVSEIFISNYDQDLQYYSTLDGTFRKYYEQEIQRAFAVLQQLSMQARRHNQTELASRIDTIIDLQMARF